MLSVYCLMQSKLTSAMPSLIESAVTPSPSDVSVGVVTPGFVSGVALLLVPEPHALTASAASMTPATTRRPLVLCRRLTCCAPELFPRPLSTCAPLRRTRCADARRIDAHCLVIGWWWHERAGRERLL